MPVVTEYATQTISVVGRYTHLGSIAHHSGLSHRELRRRIAIGNAAFTAHRKTLFQNGSFSLRRRAELFQSIVLSKVVYGMETWYFHDVRLYHYFRSAIFRLYRRLLKLPPTEKLTEDEVLALTALPDPAHLLSIARLRYLGLLYKCDTITPWAHLRQDVEWMHLVQTDLKWLWGLISDTSRLRDPSQHFCDWQYVLRYHRSYWRKLLLRGQRLCSMRGMDQLLLRSLHHDVLAHLEEHGTLSTATVRPAIDAHQETQHYGCMSCAKRCRNRAGEGAHLFKAHGIVAAERFWMASTTCEVCLKEFYSFDKLQVHLRTATACRETMNAKPYTQVTPGFGSRANEALRESHDGLLPVQQAHGPHGLRPVRREFDRHHVELFETLALAIYEAEEEQTLETLEVMTKAIKACAIGWTQLKATLAHLRDSFTVDSIMDAQLSLVQIRQIIDRLGDVTHPEARNPRFGVKNAFLTSIPVCR